MIKSYTDLEQSKKLAEILPVDSADMYYPNRKYIDCDYALPIKVKRGAPLLSQEIPCWSLVALLATLPSVITRNEKKLFLTLEKAGAYNLYYKSSDRLDELWETKEEPVDACYEMILMLHEHEQKLSL